jgi:hypothetical protein
MIQKISDYIQKHEKLLIVIGALALVLFLGNKWINHEAKVAELENNKAQAIAAQQAVVVQNLTAQLQAAQQHSDAVAVQMAAQAAAQEAEIASLRSSLAQQQAAIKTKPLPEITVQWNGLIGVPDGIQNTDKGLLVNEVAARATVSQLVEVPVLSAEIEDLKKMVSEGNSTTVAQESTIRASEALISGLNTQITDNKTACTKEVAAIKAEEVKSKRKWAIVGYVLGLATRGAIKLGLGI